MFAPDRAAGIRVLEVFAKAFRQPIPNARSPQPLAPLRFATAVLAAGVQRGQEGGFGRDAGPWTATKWFLQPDGYEAEVYFNYDLQDRVAEFSEKDEGYREDLLGVLAQVLRDGPRPDRSPADDPNLQAEGPRFSDWRKLSARASAGTFTVDGTGVVYQEKDPQSGERLLWQSVSIPAAPTELFKSDGHITDRHPLDDAGRRHVVLESHPTQSGLYSSEDPARILLVSDGTAREVKGPWGRRPGLPESAVSPDHRYVAVYEWRDRTDGKRGRYRVLHACSLASGRIRSFADTNVSWDLVRWEGSRERPQALLADGLSFEKRPLSYRRMDPETGEAKSVEGPRNPRAETPASPDGKRSFRLVKGVKLVFEGSGVTPRDFVFHEDDVRLAEEGCCQWVSPRYVFFNGRRPAFIDAQNLKMSFPAEPKEDVRGLLFRRDFAWVLSQREDGLWLGRVIVPGSPER